jgi:DNA-binding NarL/FixJ family response regulator
VAGDDHGAGLKGQTERQVRACLVQGLSNKEIRAQLHLSKSAVNFHITALMRKYDLWGTADQRRLIVALVEEHLARRTSNEHRTG